MRVVDSIMALPAILALIFVLTLRPSVRTVILALTLLQYLECLGYPGEALMIMKRDFILQAKVAGCSSLRIKLDPGLRWI